VIIFGADKSRLMEVQKLWREGSNLVFKGKIMGAMPVTAVVKPSQARALVKLLNWRTRLFLLTLLFRRDS
jgi:hypothetical protein